MQDRWAVVTDIQERVELLHRYFFHLFPPGGWLSFWKAWIKYGLFSQQQIYMKGLLLEGFY